MDVRIILRTSYRVNAMVQNICWGSIEVTMVCPKKEYKEVREWVSFLALLNIGHKSQNTFFFIKKLLTNQ